jgi:protein-S-isoprenylcysteine O-methyltransferase Ste14
LANLYESGQVGELVDAFKNFLGFVFFLGVAVLSAVSAWQAPTVLAWVMALHNLILALIYLFRQPADTYDRKGLWLGLIAALLPSIHALPEMLSPLATWIGLASYGLILWSLCTLGGAFGIAPADRGLVVQGPYRFVRHPMYLGELVLRFVLIIASPQPVLSALFALALVVVQIARSLREEKVIQGYRLYANWVRWRLIPGIW